MRKYSRTLVGALAIGLAVTLIGGCGSESGTNVGNYTAENIQQIQQQVASRPFILGRVLVDTDFVGLPVEIVSSEGQVLQRFTTTKRGWFFRAGSLPDNFTVVARRGNDTFRREIRGGWKRGTLYVNAATTLASAYLRAHPNLTLAQAEDKVRVFLKLAKGYKLSWLTIVSSPGFSHAALFQEIQRAGSLDTYLDQQLALMDLSPSIVTSVLKTGGKIALGAATGVAKVGATDVVGAAVNRMGYNFTTRSALKELSDDLDDVNTELKGLIDGLENLQAQKSLANELTGSNNALSAINGTLSSIGSGIVAFIETHDDDNTTFNGPTDEDSQIAALKTSVLSTNLDEQVGNITSVFNGSVQKSFNKAQLAGLQLPAGDQDLFQGYVWRKNDWTRNLSSFVAKYMDVINGGIYLYFENAHLSDPSAQATQLQRAINKSAEFAGQIQIASQFAPDLLPADTVMLDMKNQVLWSKEFLPPMSWVDASSAAYNLEFGPLGGTDRGFHLPERDQIDALIRNRVIGPTQLTVSGNSWKDASRSIWTTAFSDYGFDTKEYTDVDDVSVIGSGDNEGTWMNYYGTTGENFYTWNGDNTNPDYETWDYSSGSSSFICCLEYPSPADDDVVQDANGSQDMSNLNAAATATNSSGPAVDTSTFNAEQRTPWSTVFVSDGASISEGAMATGSWGIQLKSMKSFDAPRRSGGRYGAGSFDVTNRCYWTSSYPAVASISNYASSTVPISSQSPPDLPPGPAGFVTFHPPVLESDPPLSPVTVSSVLYGVDGNGSDRVSVGTYTLNPPAGLVAKLITITFLPRNTTYVFSTRRDVIPEIAFFATAGFQDGRIIDVSTNDSTTWSVLDPTGAVLDEEYGGFGVRAGAAKNKLTLNGTCPFTTLTIKVQWTYKGTEQTDTATIGLTLPQS